jgi:hypothetical protein
MNNGTFDACVAVFHMSVVRKSEEHRGTRRIFNNAPCDYANCNNSLNFYM